MRRKLDDWYRAWQQINQDEVSLNDRATACWTRDGRKFSRGEIISLLRSSASKWNKWRRALPDIEWYKVDGRHFWLPGFVARLPKCDLRNIDFSNYELVGIDFNNSNFSRSKFNSVDFD